MAASEYHFVDQTSQWASAKQKKGWTNPYLRLVGEVPTALLHESEDSDTN